MKFFDKRKVTLCATMIAILVIGIGYIVANSENTNEEDPITDYQYTIENNEATIIRYVGKKTKAVIPAVINGSNVISIGNHAFASCESLKDIAIPNNVISIGDGAFAGCESLISMIIPDGVTSIGYGAFFACQSLTNITLSNNITSISLGMFSGCKSLTKISIPNSVTSIDHSVFHGCESLISITIPDSVTLINYDTFFGCENLQSIYFEGNVPEVDKHILLNKDIKIYYKANTKGWTNPWNGYDTEEY